MTQVGGVLAIWHDIVPSNEAQVLRWYDQEHHPERVRIPGFRRARRYVALNGQPKYFINYEVESSSVLETQDYLSRVNNPTPWTQDSMVHFRNNIRTGCRIRHRQPGATGAAVATLRLSPRQGNENELEQTLIDEIFPALRHKYDELLRCELWTADLESTNISSSERAIRDGPDQLVDWVAVLHATTSSSLTAITNDDLSDSKLRTLGFQPDFTVGLYTLQYTLEIDDLYNTL